MSDSATEVTFDIAKRRIRVPSKRPWFVPARSFGFLDFARFGQSIVLPKMSIHGKGSLHQSSRWSNDPAGAGKREPERSHPKLLEEIRRVTGMAA
jgi:hypothetical protein